jgi:hypothetical protein
VEGFMACGGCMQAERARSWGSNRGEGGGPA